MQHKVIISFSNCAPVCVEKRGLGQFFCPKIWRFQIKCVISQHLTKENEIMKMKPQEIDALIEASRVINRHFGIRVTECRTSRLCSLTRLALVLDDVARALHLASKAMKDQRQNPTFRAKGHTIVFFWR